MQPIEGIASWAAGNWYKIRTNLSTASQWWDFGSNFGIVEQLCYQMNYLNLLALNQKYKIWSYFFQAHLELNQQHHKKKHVQMKRNLQLMVDHWWTFQEQVQRGQKRFELLYVVHEW